MSIMLQTNLIRTDKELAANRPTPPPPSTNASPGSRQSHCRQTNINHTRNSQHKRENSAKPIPDLQAGEREEMPLLAVPHRLAAAASSSGSAPEKLRIPRIKRQIRSRRPQIRTRIEQNRGASLLRSSCTFAEVSSVLPWHRAYPHAKVVGSTARS